jgi:micrococcal nuclease
VTAATSPPATAAPILRLAPAPPPTVPDEPIALADPAADCDPSYPGVCIPPGPPDLDCPDIAFRRFTVVGADGHRFDADHDGIGCESA